MHKGSHHWHCKTPQLERPPCRGRHESLCLRSPKVGVQAFEEILDLRLGFEHVKSDMLPILRNDFVFALRSERRFRQMRGQVATHRATGAKPNIRILRATRPAFGSRERTLVQRKATRACRERQRCQRVRVGDQVSCRSFRRRSKRLQRAHHVASRATRSPWVQSSRASRSEGREERPVSQSWQRAPTRTWSSRIRAAQ